MKENTIKNNENRDNKEKPFMVITFEERMRLLGWNKVVFSE